MTADVPKRVVILCIAGMGNSLMAMPMVRQIKRAWPSCRITVLARNSSIGEPLKRLPEVDELLYTGVGISALFRSVRWTRQRKPDVYLIPFPSNRWHYSLLTLTSGAKTRVLHSYPAGYWRAMHFIGRRLAAERAVHDVVQNLRLLRLLGIEPDETESPRFNVNETDRAAAAKLLTAAGIDAHQKFIAIHAGSGSYTVIARAKRWPPQRYAELIAAMRSEFGLPIVLLEGPDESGVTEQITRCMSPESPGSLLPGFHTLKLTGPLGDAAAVLERAVLYVGSDSGLAHLAAAVGKRAVTIFAPADPDRVCPFGSRDLVVQTDRPCSPCFTYPFQTPYTAAKCCEPFCIDGIPVEKVLEAVRRALQVPSPAGRGSG